MLLHVSTIITTVSSNTQDTFHLLLLGGGHENDYLTNCWILNLSNLKWFQVIIHNNYDNVELTVVIIS